MLGCVTQSPEQKRAQYLIADCLRKSYLPLKLCFLCLPALPALKLLIWSVWFHGRVVTGKRLISPIYKEFLEISKKNSDPIGKMCKR